MNLTTAVVPGSRAARNTFAFFVSYARSAPIPGTPDVDVDAAAKSFFGDLEKAVIDLARRSMPDRTQPVQGYFDHQISASADPELGEALSRAQVFVPLYSPTYANMPWALREYDLFLRRLDSVGRRGGAAGDLDAHIVPVLWTPFPSWRLPAPSIRPALLGPALELGRDVGEYPENGLRALHILRGYHVPYTTILDRLATRIVELVRSDPLPVSRLVDTDDATPTPTPTTSAAAADVVVSVVVPDHASETVRRAPERYFERDVRWSPFMDREVLPVAEHAARTAERFGLQPHVEAFDRVLELSRSLPVLVLVDPWALSEPDGEEHLRARFVGLPEWVVPLVVSDGTDPRNLLDGQRLTEAAQRILAALRGPNASVHAVTDVKSFAKILPDVLGRARRQYLRYGPVKGLDGGHPRPTLGGGALDDTSTGQGNTTDE